MDDHRVISGISNVIRHWFQRKDAPAAKWCETLEEGNIEADRQCVATLLPWVLSRQFRQPKTVRWKPPFIEVGHAEQQSLLPGRLHVPERKGRRRQAERQGAQSDVHV